MFKKESASLLSLPLELTASQHLCCTAKVGIYPAYFLIDTGASHSCFAKEKHSAFGLELSAKKIQASAANKTAMDAQKSLAIELSFGAHSMELSFMVMDFEPINNSLAQYEVAAIDGILGADFLLQTHAVIRYADRTMELEF